MGCQLWVNSCCHSGEESRLLWGERPWQRNALGSPPVPVEGAETRAMDTSITDP